MTNQTIFRYLPQWFVAAFALIYISGYFVDFLYYSSIGIEGAGTDLLKLKYLQIGINFLVLFSIIIVPTFF
jgi:hypothetical protein